MTEKDYEFKLDRQKINRLTCRDNTQPKDGDCKVDTNEYMTCGPGEQVHVELFDLEQQRIQDLDVPVSLGMFRVTKEMMECMVGDKL